MEWFGSGILIVALTVLIVIQISITLWRTWLEYRRYKRDKEETQKRLIESERRVRALFQKMSQNRKSLKDQLDQLADYYKLKDATGEKKQKSK